jgi:hypothetical protein
MDKEHSQGMKGLTSLLAVPAIDRERERLSGRYPS